MRYKLSTTAIAVVLVPALALGAAACSGQQTAGTPTVAGQSMTSAAGGSNSTAATGSAASSTSGTASAAAATISTEALSPSWAAEDTEATWDTASAYAVTLNGHAIAFTGTGATVSGSSITITQPGTYVLSGTLNDGQVVVDTNVGGNVRLVLNGADITSTTGAAIYVKNADKTIITLAEGTQNKVTDGSTRASSGSGDTQTSEPDAAVYSKDDLSINGAGALTVKATYKDGIATTNDLKIAGGTITVDAVKDALKGKDSVAVKAGTFVLTAGVDGLQASNDQDATKGYVAVEGGTFTIKAGGDAIQAATTLGVADGDFTLTTGGGSANGKQQGASGAASTSTAVDSSKGLKGTGGVFVSGGTFAIDSADDSVHSNGTIKTTAGTIGIKSGDDGIHADVAFQIDGGDITITQSYEGIESMLETINGGTVHITSSDDGINVAGGADGSAAGNFAGRGGGDMSNNANNVLRINGGYVSVDAGGDGLDSNGSVYITDGTIVVNGPTNNGNGAIDYNGAGQMTGGFLVAVGSSGMAEMPDSSSSICSIMVNFDSAQQAGTLVHVESADGEDVVTIAPSKQFQSIVVASAAIKQGTTYKVFLGGSSTGTLADTVYTGGDYTGGSEHVSLAVEGILTTSGQTGGFGGPGGNGRQRPGQGTQPGQ